MKKLLIKNKWIILWYILALIAVFFLSLNGIGWRFLTTDEWLNPILVVFLRFFLGALLLLFFLLFFSKKQDFVQLLKSKKPLQKSKNFWFSGIFLFLVVLTFILWLKYSSASNIVLIQSLSPILVALITIIFYPGFRQKYNYRKIFFIAIIASIWSSLLVSDNSLTIISDNNLKFLWDLLAFASMVFFALFSYYYVELKKEFDNSNWLVITFFFLCIWLLLSLPSLFFFYTQLFSISLIWLYFIWIIWFASTWLAYLLWFYAGKHLSALTLVVIYNLVWLLTIISEFLFYSDTSNKITYKLYIWAFLIISSLYYMNYIQNKKVLTK